MPPQSEPDRPLLCSLAGKLTSLSKTEISLLSDDALNSLVMSELSRLPKDEFNRFVEDEISPFLPIVVGILEAFVSQIFHPPKPKPKPKPKEEETLIVSGGCNLTFILVFVQHFYKWLDLKRDVPVTTIAPQEGFMIPSIRPIDFSKYSESADVQGLKGIRNLRKAKTVFRQPSLYNMHKDEND
ncbi:hypothetical protein TSUD_239200 [Trifolium subterraneum]|uniref:Uncharacterized protein n=1 Tax=Trifolium subterraneum TaxID=3900 RepID=A0A2Z6NZJ9_TRISU|nr:hypothetical protein TSUD_239200 [Trifolium subterraneum]